MQVHIVSKSLKARNISEEDGCIISKTYYFNLMVSPPIRVNGSGRRPFNLILDRILENVTLNTWMNLSPYLNFYEAEKAKS